MIYFRWKPGAKEKTLENIQSSFDGENWIHGAAMAFWQELQEWLASGEGRTKK